MRIRQINCRLGADYAEKLKYLAKKENVYVSDIVRGIIIREIREHEELFGEIRIDIKKLEEW